MQIGIDLGGTKIEIIALDDAGATLHQARVATPAGNYAAILDCIAALVTAVERRHGRAQGIGIGTPGSLSRVDGAMKNSNSVCLNGQPLRDDLQARLGRSVHIANDANCFALSEAVDGAGAGSAIVFGVILGTGVGGGLAVNGRVIDGPNGITGEWGHNPLVLGDRQGRDAPRRRASDQPRSTAPAVDSDSSSLRRGAPGR